MDDMETLYSKLYSKNKEDLREGLDLVNQNKPYALSIGIIATCDLALAIYHDSSDELFSFISSMALIRFVNLIVETSKQLSNTLVESKEPLTKHGKKLNIPEWVINLRHDAAHGNIPTVENLRLGVYYALQWLEENFWIQYNSKTSNKSRHFTADEYIVEMQNNITTTLIDSHKMETNYLIQDVIPNIIPLCNAFCRLDLIAKNRRTFRTIYWRPVFQQLIKEDTATLFVVKLLDHYAHLITSFERKTSLLAPLDKTLYNFIMYGILCTKTPWNIVVPQKFIQSVSWPFIIKYILMKFASYPSRSMHVFIKKLILKRLNTESRRSKVLSKILHLQNIYFT